MLDRTQTWVAGGASALPDTKCGGKPAMRGAVDGANQVRGKIGQDGSEALRPPFLLSGDAMI